MPHYDAIKKRATMNKYLHGSDLNNVTIIDCLLFLPKLSLGDWLLSNLDISLYLPMP